MNFTEKKRGIRSTVRDIKQFIFLRQDVHRTRSNKFRNVLVLSLFPQLPRRVAFPARQIPSTKGIGWDWMGEIISIIREIIQKEKIIKKDFFKKIIKIYREINTAIREIIWLRTGWPRLRFEWRDVWRCFWFENPVRIRRASWLFQADILPCRCAVHAVMREPQRGLLWPESTNKTTLQCGYCITFSFHHPKNDLLTSDAFYFHDLELCDQDNKRIVFEMCSANLRIASAAWTKDEGRRNIPPDSASPNIHGKVHGSR